MLVSDKQQDFPDPDDWISFLKAFFFVILIEGLIYISNCVSSSKPRLTRQTGSFVSLPPVGMFSMTSLVLEAFGFEVVHIDKSSYMSEGFYGTKILFYFIKH